MSASNGATPPRQNVPNNAGRMRIAAEYRWAHPDATWEAVADHVGVVRQTLGLWRQTEAWEIIHREVALRYVNDLAGDAVAALRKAWKRGNPSGAIEVLRALTLLRGQELTVNHHIDRDLDAEIEKLLSVVRHSQ